MPRWAALWGVLLAGPAVAADPAPGGPDLAFDWGGHVKIFGVVGVPYGVEDLPDDLLHELLNPLPSRPFGQAFVDGRLFLRLEVDDWFQVEGAHAVTTTINADAVRDGYDRAVVDALAAEDALQQLAPLQALGDGADALLGGGGGGGAPFATGVGLSAPELVPLTYRVGDDPLEDVRLQLRTDRLFLKFSPDRFDVTVGRQAISFGNGRFFTPLDLVSPFTPATVDTEYKPGVDAFRFDAFPTFSTQVTALVAYTGQTYVYEDAAEGEPLAARLSAAAYAQGTVGITDLGGLYSFNRGDHVVGATVASGIGPVGIYGDVAVTVPRADLDEPVFVRATVGLDGRPTDTTTLGGELYVQSFGTTDPEELFDLLSRERVRRGEVWQAGLAYLGFNVSQEITPLLTASLGLVSNLTDPSFLLLPSVRWDVAGNVVLSFGGVVGAGARPYGRRFDPSAISDTPSRADLSVITPRSEFGTYPATLFVQASAYF